MNLPLPTRQTPLGFDLPAGQTSLAGTGERMDTCVLISVWLCRGTSQQAHVHTADPKYVLQSGAEGTPNLKTKTSSAMVLSVAGEAERSSFG